MKKEETIDKAALKQAKARIAQQDFRDRINVALYWIGFSKDKPTRKDRIEELYQSYKLLNEFTNAISESVHTR